MKIGAIVNAANKYMLGCFTVGFVIFFFLVFLFEKFFKNKSHKCIDNVIHAAAGFRLREACMELMNEQKHLEETGECKVTKAFCLPSEHVLVCFSQKKTFFEIEFWEKHTVGPIIDEGEQVSEEKASLLSSCYRKCLETCSEKGIRSISFCCISTGVFRYPKTEAAKVALSTVREWLLNSENHSKVDFIVFNTFTLEDTQTYEKLIHSFF